MVTVDKFRGRQQARAGEAPKLRLLRPEPVARLPELDAEQSAVADAPAGHGPLLVWGAPGTGKSTMLLETAAHRVERDGIDPAEVLFLAPSRAAAARLREGLTSRLGRTLSVSPVRSWAAYAFDALRREHALRSDPGNPSGLRSAPRLISGPEQDLLLRELLEGHRLGIVPGPAWPEDFDLALPSRGFRQEVRQLFDRMVDYGLRPADLRELAVQAERPEWAAAAELFAEYRDLLELRAEGLSDPAGLVREVADRLADSPEFALQERSRYRLILVDDLQETGPSGHALLTQLGAGQDLVATAAPDVVVQGFRGARPDLVADLREELGAAEAVLSSSHRMPPAIAAAWERVAARIAQRRGGHKARRLEAVQPESRPGQVVSVVLGSQIQERRFLAERVLHFHIDQGRPFAEMAVIVRSGSQVASVERYLNSQGIPVRVPVAETPVRDEPAIRPLLTLYRAALEFKDAGAEPLDAETVTELLTSRIGGMDSLQVRRLRQQLRLEEMSAGGSRSSDELLSEAIWLPALLSQLSAEGRAASRIARVLAAGRSALETPGASPQSVLWALWQATGLSTVWADEALRPDVLGHRADHDLDAMMALFETAERFTERRPGASPEVFLDDLLGQELPMDTLAPRGQGGDAVSVLTPASAAGRQWPVVLIAGLQEGRWPDIRLRGELLGSQYLVDVMEHGVAVARKMTAAHRMRDIRYDELRSFSAALSRSSEVLICTGVSAADEQPSSFLDLVDPYRPEDPSQPAERPVTEAARPKNLRSLVAELRQVLESRYLELPAAQQRGAVTGAGTPGSHFDEPARSGEPEAAEAAALLAALASRNVTGASPEQWWGIAPLSSEAPILPTDVTVPVSPSRIETALASPLNWFLQAAGAEVSRDLARSLGTLIHAIAQDLPEANHEEYLAELDRRWPELGLPETWISAADYSRARRMLGKLADYVRLMNAEKRRLLAVEPAFDVEVHGQRIARLRGRVDRLEIDELGRLVVIDLKTGRNKPTRAAIEEHEQLGAYQVAVNQGAFRSLLEESSAVETGHEVLSGGAALVQLGGETKSVDEQRQAALDLVADWMTPRIGEAAVIMSAAEFAAVHDPATISRRGCPLPEVCPLCRGRQVTE